MRVTSLHLLLSIAFAIDFFARAPSVRAENDIEMRLELAETILPLWAPVIARVSLENRSDQPLMVTGPRVEDGSLGFIRRRERGEDTVIPQDDQKLYGKRPVAVEPKKLLYWNFMVFRKYEQFVNDRPGKEEWLVVARQGATLLRSQRRTVEFLISSDEDKDVLSKAAPAMKAMNWALEGIQSPDKAAEVRSILAAAKEKIASKKWKEQIASFERMLAGSGDVSDESLAAWCEENHQLAGKSPIQAEVEAIAVAHSLLRRGMHDWSDKVIEPYPSESRDRWALMEVNTFQREAIEYEKKKQVQEHK